MKPVSPAIVYALLLPDLMRAGREVGYAVAVHGSLGRDLDIVAIPWTEEAVSALELVEHLRKEVDGSFRNEITKGPNGEDVFREGVTPVVKPHGRRAWSIHLGLSGLYLDVSVMPSQLPEVTNVDPTSTEVDLKPNPTHLG